MESHIKTGALVATYLKTEMQIDIASCRESDRTVFFKNGEASDFNLQAWVAGEKLLGEESVMGRVLKDRKLSWDHVPVSSCRLWPQIVNRIPEVSKNPEN